ncbi:hypothetical protein G5V59_12945 [Nocardioides sp. W3-2-3]|uniref:hypothetical protein n=1 Tax=Nocardioides convexus TaxID=2712224 RepID=UPI00241876B5|nr:hypothetical protein [Nocardioides convexus]NHA00621.1 hypothetical protein [Nocardioides convexus]
MLPTGGRPTDIETIHAQYDALGTGLAIAGIDPGILQDRAYRGIEYSVLEIIRPSPTEPDLIAQDMQHFGWTRSREVNEHVRRIEDNGRILDVVNLNATKQEAATGVDLLYYNETFESLHRRSIQGRPMRTATGSRESMSG